MSESWGPDLHAAKQALAYAVTETVHGKSTADKAQVAAQAAFGSGGTGDLVPTCSITATNLAAGLRIVDLLHAAGLAVSKGGVRRQGGGRLGERKVTSVDDLVRPDEIAPDGTLLRAGKKHLRRIVID